MYPTPIEHAPVAGRVAYRGALYLTLLVWMLPLIAILMTALRSQGDLLAGNYWGLPAQISLVENFREIFTGSPMGMFFLNSLIITVLTVAGVLVLSTLAAVALAKYPFPGRTFLFALFIGGNFVPYQILMIPVRNIVLYLGLYDTIWALILFHTAFRPDSRHCSCAISSPRCRTSCSKRRGSKVRASSGSFAASSCRW